MVLIKDTYFQTTRSHTEDTIDRTYNLETRDDDVFLLSYPRTGTTWTQNIMLALKRDTEFLKEVTDGETLAHHFTFLELVSHFFTEPVDVRVARQESPRFFKTHLPVQSAPKEIQEKHRKCVFIFRNPKDCVISFHKFYHSNARLDAPESFDSFVKEFQDGTVNYGGYWNWCKYWFNYINKNPETCFVMFYEDLLADFDSNVRALGKFLGFEPSDEKLKAIKEATSIESMSNRIQIFDSFIGQGQSKSYEKKLSKEVIDDFDRRTRESLSDTGYLDKFLV
ncbi:amine sulfotransferase-like [Symsagittifera roscoffensis]|uniref:amine sulfotransferase-like n=1 Tax=Symsagittifera roscoffensis TaxID=84072 RepID=UPI00307BBC43